LTCQRGKVWWQFVLYQNHVANFVASFDFEAYFEGKWSIGGAVGHATNASDGAIFGGGSL